LHIITSWSFKQCNNEIYNDRLVDVVVFVLVRLIGVDTNRPFCDGLPWEKSTRGLTITNDITMHTFYLNDYPEYIEKTNRSSHATSSSLLGILA